MPHFLRISEVSLDQGAQAETLVQLAREEQPSSPCMKTPSVSCISATTALLAAC